MAVKAAIYSHYLIWCVYSIGRLKSKDEQQCPRESQQITLLQPARERERVRVGGKEARCGSMAPDQWSIGRSHQYTSCWRSELWLHRWKWVGRARVWWWFMLAGQMFHFGERLSNRHAWMSSAGQWVSILTLIPMDWCWSAGDNKTYWYKSWLPETRIHLTRKVWSGFSSFWIMVSF